MSAFVEDACSRCLNTPCTCPREFENFILGAGWNRERLYGECCMHVDDDGSFDCDRALEFFRGSDDGACEEHAEAMGAIVRKAAVPTTPVPEARLAAAYDAYTNPKETNMPTATPKTHALQIAQSLDDYLDARDEYESHNDGNEMGEPIPEVTRRRVGETRVAFVEALEAAIDGAA